jgi:hypothetical protein
MNIIHAYKSIREMYDFEIDYAIQSIRKMNDFYGVRPILYLEKSSKLPDRLLKEYKEIKLIEEKYSSVNIWAGIKFIPMFEQTEPFFIIDLDAYIKIEIEKLFKYDFVFAHLESRDKSRVYIPEALNPNYPHPKWFDTEYSQALNASFMFFNEKAISIFKKYKEIFEEYVHYHSGGEIEEKGENLPAIFMCIVEQWMLLQYLIHNKLNIASVYKNPSMTQDPNTNIPYISSPDEQSFKHIGQFKGRLFYSNDKKKLETYDDVIAQLAIHSYSIK